MSWSEHKRLAPRPGAYTYRIVDWVLGLVLAAAGALLIAAVASVALTYT